MHRANESDLPVTWRVAKTALERLKEIGFEQAGSWQLDRDRLRCHLTSCAESKRVLYAFVAGTDVLYVGKSVRTLTERIKGYERPGPTQRTNIRAHERIREFLGTGGTIELYVFVDPGNLTHRGLAVNLAAGLEDSLIEEVRPAWNVVGR